MKVRDERGGEGGVGRIELGRLAGRVVIDAAVPRVEPADGPSMAAEELLLEAVGVDAEVGVQKDGESARPV